MRIREVRLAQLGTGGRQAALRRGNHNIRIRVKPAVLWVLIRELLESDVWVDPSGELSIAVVHVVIPEGLPVSHRMKQANTNPHDKQRREYIVLDGFREVLLGTLKPVGIQAAMPLTTNFPGDFLARRDVVHVVDDVGEHGAVVRAGRHDIVRHDDTAVLVNVVEGIIFKVRGVLQVIQAKRPPPNHLAVL